MFYIVHTASMSQSTLSPQKTIDCLKPAWKEHSDDRHHRKAAIGKFGRLSFLVFSAGSDEVKTLKPKSPAAAGVPGD